jgi:hypothetical protein
MGFGEVFSKVTGKARFGFDAADVDDGASDEFVHPGAQATLGDVGADVGNVKVWCPAPGQFHDADVPEGFSVVFTFEALEDGSPCGRESIELCLWRACWVWPDGEGDEPLRLRLLNAFGELAGLSWAAVGAGPAATTRGRKYLASGHRAY